MSFSKETMKKHYCPDKLNKIQEQIALHIVVIQLLILGTNHQEIAVKFNISASKVSRIKKLHFPTLPYPARDGSSALRRRKEQKTRWSDLNARDRRVVRMLLTQSYEQVAEKNDLSIGTIHNIAHYYSDQLQERKITRKT